MTERTVDGVTLLGDFGRQGRVTFAFTERTGGVSVAPFSSLNLGDHVGDDASSVAENRALALAALGASAFADSLVVPNQVHGDRVVSVASSDPADVAAVQAAARQGADAVVCTAPCVPVLLCYADCVPVVLVAPGGFAVVHSGWKGTYARIAQKALGVLCDAASASPSEVVAYIGPHIAGCDYEVSIELLNRFETEFGSMVEAGPRRLSLAAAIEKSLVSAGMDPCNIVNPEISTPASTDRFFSYRAEGGVCGRHGAIAWLAP
ncbi:polyphenol oxidase family protein [Atopobiaceae bacterium 24-176]